MTLTYDQTAPEQLAALLAELRDVRRQHGDLTQGVLAARLEVVTASLASWEAGRENPSALHLMNWSRELGRRVAITDSIGNEIPAAADINAAQDESDAQRELRRLAATLRTVRARRQLPQAPLAAQIGVNRRSITRWENAEGYPRSIAFVRWARALECNVQLFPT